MKIVPKTWCFFAIITKNHLKWIGGREFIPHLRETCIVEYDSSNGLRSAKSPLRICPIVAHSDYQGGSVTGMTLVALVDLIYMLREDYSVQILSLDSPYKEIFSYINELAYVIGLETKTEAGIKDFHLKVISVILG